MKPLRSFLLHGLVFSVCSAFSSCSYASDPSVIIFEGSTPGGQQIRSALGLGAEKKIDFIKWSLTLNSDKPAKNTFTLTIIFGEAQQNTSGFKGGGVKQTFQGNYRLSKKNPKTIESEIYQLNSTDFQTAINLLKLNENLVHLLNPDFTLMVGNGGWSYTLNRTHPVNVTSVIKNFADAPSLLSDTTRQLIFDGRTPCQEISNLYNWSTSADCFKLKWTLILSKDAKTLMPTTYQLKSTLNRREDMSGTWAVSREKSLDNEILIYQLDPDHPEKSLCFFVADENVLFFLTKDHKLFVGNKDFSYTLNKRNRLIKAN